MTRFDPQSYGSFIAQILGEDRLNALRAGFQTHVPKPANLEELAGAVALLSLRREAVLAF